MRDLLDVLRVCVRTTPALLGSTVWGMTDIHRVLGSLAPAQKNKPQSLYFVKVGWPVFLLSATKHGLYQITYSSMSEIRFCFTGCDALNRFVVYGFVVFCHSSQAANNTQSSRTLSLRWMWVGPTTVCPTPNSWRWFVRFCHLSRKRHFLCGAMPKCGQISMRD